MYQHKYSWWIYSIISERALNTYVWVMGTMLNLKCTQHQSLVCQTCFLRPCSNFHGKALSLLSRLHQSLLYCHQGTTQVAPNSSLKILLFPVQVQQIAESLEYPFRSNNKKSCKKAYISISGGVSVRSSRMLVATCSPWGTRLQL